MQVLTAAQMRDADADACARVGESIIMATAGRRIAALIQRYARSNRVVAFAGPGNNGGDAYAALAELDSSFDRRIYAARTEKPSSARADAQRRARQAGVRMLHFPETPTDARQAVEDAGIVIDALFGTGARLPMQDPYATAARAINNSDSIVLCVDIPSGIDA
ncbi:MAG: bifunctional ADP-dependent NAD(P)H-hydrate dehydratase/NAD(P)H-hydrate epimerase, partial [Candidatus Eremiobacteraeota bacterium]|nr:bifunctional ADP-dependent NAD(P)H-hydrate dehydratase/NAD(P)H-hydrate epimerase [Candidatus Eremiobacteraeota bacterium]